jgi:hypothetical protein
VQYTLNLPANTPIRQGTSGSFFLLTDIGAASSIDVQFNVHSQVAEHITQAKRGLKAALHGGDTFTGIVFQSAVACVITFIISNGVVDISQLDGANVNATIANAFPLPVSNDRGSPGSPIFVNGTISGNPTAAALVNDAPVAMTAAFASIVAANANRVSIRFTNTGANVVALGAAGLTFANGAILLQPGDTWVEERAANLAWGGICGAGLASTIAVQEVMA